MPMTMTDLQSYGSGHDAGVCREDFQAFPSVANAGSEPAARLAARLIVTRCQDRHAMIFDALKDLVDAVHRAHINSRNEATMARLMRSLENAQDEIERVEEA